MLTNGTINTETVFVSKDLIDLDINQWKVSVNNVFKKYDGLKEAVKNSTTFNSDNKYA